MAKAATARKTTKAPATAAARGKAGGRRHKIAVLPGDGIGEEVVREGLKVLDVVAGMEGFAVDRKVYPHGADHYLATKEAMPAEALAEMGKAEAIYLGAIGDPRIEVGYLERQIIWGVRQTFDLYVNQRPIRLYHENLCPLKDKKPSDIDMVVVRENTEDAYAGLGGIHRKGTPHEVAIAEMIYTRNGVERVIRYAYEVCKRRNKKRRLTLVDKANAIRAQDIWTRTFAEVGKEFPEIEQDHAYIDAACMWMVKSPEWFDTIVTPNLFGDILTDIGAMIQGGLGIAASGNIHPGAVSMFEPIHGSAPKYRGQNSANPIAAIEAVRMLLDHVGEPRAARRIEGAVRHVIETGKVRSLKAGAYKCDEVGDMIVEAARAGAGL
ncbi:MAG TPA: 3-isopropylmalate dehydrogenase [Planctomycetota bacterium]|nr:3-isopropylmalate dehydrogenase [Planctomycetota bacterium]